MSVKKQDLRVTRTHILIRKAFIELLQNQEFDKISVQDIVNKAMVNRATFYKYYSGKSDLAEAVIADFKAEYQNLITVRLESTSINVFIDQALPFIKRNASMLLALWKIKTKRHHLYDDMFLMIKQLFIQLAIQKFGMPQNADEWDYQAEMFANFVLFNLKYYLQKNDVVPLDQVIEKIENMIAVIKN